MRKGEQRLGPNATSISTNDCHRHVNYIVAIKVTTRWIYAIVPGPPRLPAASSIRSIWDRSRSLVTYNRLYIYICLRPSFLSRGLKKKNWFKTDSKVFPSNIERNFQRPWGFITNRIKISLERWLCNFKDVQSSDYVSSRDPVTRLIVEDREIELVRLRLYVWPRSEGC